MRPQDLLAAKRDGLALDPEDIAAFIKGVTDGSVGQSQIGAFTMAVCINGMNVEERVALTKAMQASGDTLAWDLPGPVIDKHSTGGVGDTVSLMLAPALAACGAYVPMISGRGLGHTGGTLDKLGTIPGYDVAPDQETLTRVVRDVGCAIIGQTGDIAPADGKIYAIRDVTGTVESVDLITASILSKKLAAGLDALVLDVKTGTGAFMAEEEDARILGQSLVSVANGAGCRTSALITDMNEPLASAAGNDLEVSIALDFLMGNQIDGRLWDIVLALGGEALHLGGLAEVPECGANQIRIAIESGAAAERFARMVAALGGPTDIFNTPRPAPAPIIREVTVSSEGFVTGIDTRALGVAVVELGGGRRLPSDEIDPAVGLDWLLGLGAIANEDTPLARVHARTEDAARRAEAAILAAYRIGPVPDADLLLVKDRLA